MSCKRYEVLLRLAPASLLGLEERKQLEKHFKECPACMLKSRELQLSYSALKAPLEPYKLDEDRIFEGILDAQNSQPVTQMTKAPEELKITLSCCYCHDKLARPEAVYCASCLSPHHKDCFKDHGLCSAIGCQERQTVTPQLEVKARPRRSRRRASFFLGSAFAVSATLVASYAIYELYSSWQQDHERLAKADLELLQKEESLEQSRLANTQLLLKSGEVYKKEREMRRLLQVERSRAVLVKAERDALETERQALKNSVQSLELRRRELNLALGRSELKQAKNQRELERLRPVLYQQKRIENELKTLRAQSKALREREEFELRYFEQQLLFLHGRRSAEELVRAGRLPQLLRKLDSEMSSSRVTVLEEIAKIGPSASFAINPLLKRLSESSLSLRIAVIEALQAMGPAADFAVLSLRSLYENCEKDPLEFESNEIDRLRLSILRALGHFGIRALLSTHHFEAALKHKNPDYARAALESMTKLACRTELVDEQNKRLRQALRRELVSVDFNKTPMKAAFQEALQPIGCPMQWSPKFRAYLENDRPELYLRLKNISVQNALQLIIANHGAAEIKIANGHLLVLVKGEKLPSPYNSPSIHKVFQEKAIALIEQFQRKSKDESLVTAAQESLARIKKSQQK